MSQFENSEKSNITRKRKRLTHEHKKKAKKTKVDLQGKTLTSKKVKPVNSNIILNCSTDEQIHSQATKDVTARKDDSSHTEDKTKSKVDLKNKTLPLKQVKPVIGNIILNCNKAKQHSKVIKAVTSHKDGSSVIAGKMSRWKRRRLHIKEKKKASKCDVTKHKPDSSKGNVSEKDASDSQMTYDGNMTILSKESVLNAKKDMSKHSVNGSVDHLKHKDKSMSRANCEIKHIAGSDAMKVEEDVSMKLSTNWKHLQPLLQKTKEENISRRRKVSTNANKDYKHKNSKTSVKIKTDRKMDHKTRNIQTSSTLIPESSEKKLLTETLKEKRRPDIWFDDVDEILIEGTQAKPLITEKKVNPLVKLGTYDGLTKAVAMDCEMVGVGEEGRESVLARVSIVNQYGNCIYDKFVKPQEDVVDYRTFVSGVTPQHLINAEQFSDVQKEVCDIMKGRILVGHALSNDLKVLFLDHSWKKIRDTSTYKPFRQLFEGKTPSLKKLTAKLLGVTVQEGEHDSVQDAQAAMRLYTMYRKRWEKDIKTGVVKLKKEKKTKIKR